MNISIIGCGNMGGALARGWAKAAREGRAPLKITATARTETKLDTLRALYPEISATTDNRSAVHTADIVVIAVKPWMVQGVLDDMLGDLSRDCVVMSVAAGATHPRIDVYAMPNLGVEFGQGMSFILRDGTAAEEHIGTARSLLELLGKVMVADKRQMDAGNMLAGCGIAYVMRMVRAMMEGGVEMGLYPDVAKDVAIQAMKGAAALLEETGLHPEAAIDKVTTAGGLTIRGLNEMDHAGFNSAVIRGLKAGIK